MNTTLSRAQLDILALLDRDLKNEDILEIKRRIVKYLAEKADKQLDQFWKENDVSDQTMDDWLNQPS